MDFLRTSKTGFKKELLWVAPDKCTINKQLDRETFAQSYRERNQNNIHWRCSTVLYCRLWTDIRPKKQTNPCPKLTIKIKEWWHWSYSGNLINNFEQIPCIVPVYLFLYLFLIYVAVNWLYINKYTNSLNAKIAII